MTVDRRGREEAETARRQDLETATRRAAVGGWRSGGGDAAACTGPIRSWTATVAAAQAARDVDPPYIGLIGVLVQVSNRRIHI
jgi:hypothetical protein